MLIHWYALTRDGDDWKIPTLASAWRQLEKFLWPEIHKWARFLRWDVIGRKPYDMGHELLKLSLRLRTGESFALASDNPSLIEGAHAANLFYIFDESKEIIDETWDSAEGAMSSGNCLLPGALVSSATAQLVSRRWYEGEIIHLTTGAGNKLAVTPDHPVLTPAGWQRAGNLHEGDDIIGCRDLQALMMVIEPDADHTPARIEDLFDAGGMLEGVAGDLFVVPGAVDLDCQPIHTQINVVDADRPLRHGDDAALAQQIMQLFLVKRIKAAVAHLGLGDLFQMLDAVGDADIAPTALGGALIGPVGVVGHLEQRRLLQIAHAHAVLFESLADRMARNAIALAHLGDTELRIFPHKGLTVGRLPFAPPLALAHLHARPDQPPVDGAGVDAQFLRDLCDRFPALVFTDHIERVVVRPYVGHVYNLQSGVHWYAANSNDNPGGIITHNCMWLSISTPGAPAGRFYDIQKRKPGYLDWWVRHIKIDEAVACGRIEHKWVEGRREQWGDKDPRFFNRVLGEFAASEEGAVIPLNWIEQANERWYEIEEAGAWSEVEYIGVDVGRYGGDYTVFAYRCRQGISHLELYGNESTTQVASRLEAALRKHRFAKASVDVIGIGAGVYDNLLEAFPERVFPFNAAEATDFEDHSEQWRFNNVRSASWWNLRQHLDPSLHGMIALPPDDLLTGELTAPMYEPIGHARYKVTSKDDIREQIGRSTDRADAVIAAYWDESEYGMAYA